MRGEREHLCDIGKGVFGAIHPLDVIFLQERVDSLRKRVNVTHWNVAITLTFLMSGIFGANRWEI